MSGVLAHFSCLDELTQVIYQGIYKFVVLSTVSDDKWDIYLGLANSKGRWWHGFWTEEDIHHIFGSKSSDKLLESFAEKLADVFILGEICITDWSSEEGAKIKFTLGPASKKPMQISLVEISPEDAAAHATKVFLEISLQAQSRKCRLYPTSVDYQPLPSTSAPLYPTTPGAGPSKRKERSPEPQIHRNAQKTGDKIGDAVQPLARDMAVKAAAAQEEIESLKTQLKQVNRRSDTPTQKPMPIVRAHKGSSLANPNKKARKYQAIEFESDEE